MPSDRCKMCGTRKPPLAVEQEDEFCSTECARRHYAASREEGQPRVVGFAGRKPHADPFWRRISRFSSRHKH